MPTYEELTETLEKQTTLPFSKVGIISSLVRLGDTRAIPHFIAALNDENHYVRREASRALGQLGSPEAMDSLLRVIENDSDEETRRNALIALGNIGDATVFEPLRQASREPSYWIRRAAEMGLEQLQKRLGVQQPIAREPLETSSAEESMNLEEITSTMSDTKSAESTLDIEDIPSYRELTDSISQQDTAETSEPAQTTSTIPEMTNDEIVSSEYETSGLTTSPLSSEEQTVSPPQQAGDTWRCGRCGAEVDSYYDICQTCGVRREDSEKERVSRETVSTDDDASVEDDDLEEWFDVDFELNCARCGKKMLEGYLFTQSDDALIFTDQEEEENDIVIGRGTQMGFICLDCNLVSFPFRGEKEIK